MSLASFVSNRLAELPAILNGDEGRAWAEGMGFAQDLQVYVLRTAALSRLPEKCPDDALDLVGQWLKLPRFQGEVNGASVPPSGYRGRLIAAWPTWLISGSKGAIIKSLQQWGLGSGSVTPNVVVLNKYEYDPGALWWSMFGVEMGVDFGSTGIAEQLWGSWTWGWDTTWGSTATVDQLTQIISQILTWKWAYAIPEYMTLIFGSNPEDETVIPLVWQWGDDSYGMVWGGFDWGNEQLWKVGY